MYIPEGIHAFMPAELSSYTISYCRHELSSQTCNEINCVYVYEWLVSIQTQPSCLCLVIIYSGCVKIVKTELEIITGLKGLPKSAQSVRAKTSGLLPDSDMSHSN